MKTYLVTGVSRGLGFSITKKLLEQSDVSVYGISRSKNENIEELLKKYKQRFFYLSFDLYDVEDIKLKIFKEFISTKVALSGFVNNAAIAYDDIISNLKYEPLEKMYRVNVFSPMFITKNVIRNILLHKQGGSIIHLSSISVHTGYKGLAMYASTKGALEAFSKNTAREWGSLQIRSNALVAGFMETDMSADLDEDQKNRIYRRNSLKKPTSVESVADTVSYLLSDASNSITGQNIHVDAGTI